MKNSLTSHDCGRGRYRRTVWGSKEDCSQCQEEIRLLNEARASLAKYPVILNFRRYMDSLEKAEVIVKSKITGRAKTVTKMRDMDDLSNKAREELMSFYPGIGATYAQCENIEGMMSRSTMLEISAVGR